MAFYFQLFFSTFVMPVFLYDSFMKRSLVSDDLIYLFVSRHEVHSMNTHTLQNAGW